MTFDRVDCKNHPIRKLPDYFPKPFYLHNFWSTLPNFINFNRDLWDHEPVQMKPTELKSVKPVLRKLSANFCYIHTHTYIRTDICSFFDPESIGIREGMSRGLSQKVRFWSDFIALPQWGRQKAIKSLEKLTFKISPVDIPSRIPIDSGSKNEQMYLCVSMCVCVTNFCNMFSRHWLHRFVFR